jgi:hypothetical protein
MGYAIISQQMDNIMATNGLIPDKWTITGCFGTAFMTNAVTVERKIQT